MAGAVSLSSFLQLFFFNFELFAYRARNEGFQSCAYNVKFDVGHIFTECNCGHCFAKTQLSIRIMRLLPLMGIFLVSKYFCFSNWFVLSNLPHKPYCGESDK